MPRKESDASMITATAITKVESTIIGAITFGRIWRNMIRRSLAPMVRAASAQTFSLAENTEPRMTRVGRGIETNAIAQNPFIRPGPSTDTIAIASTRNGIVCTASTMRCTTRSNLPPI